MLEAPGINDRGLARFATFSVPASIVVVLLLFVLALSSVATAATPPPSVAGGRVRVLQPSTISARARRCLTRLREELVAGGFEVTMSEFGVGGEALWMVDPPTPRDGSLATLTLIGNPDEGAAELWIVNGVPWGRAVVRRLLVPAGAGTHDDEVLAIRALEFLRASAIELAGTRPPAPATAPPPATSTTAAPTATANAASTVNPPASSPTPAGAAPSAVAPAADSTTPLLPTRPFALDLGLSLMVSSPALTPAFLPVARFRAEWVPLFETRLTVAGFGTQPRLEERDKGSAAIGHFLALAELRAAFRHGRAVRPAIGVGVGGLRVNVEGSATSPYEGTGAERWSALFDAGAGITARLSGRISLAFELHGQLAAPYPTVTFSGKEAARLGRPALFSSVSLVTEL